MKLTHYWNLFVLLVSSTQLSNGQVTFGLQGTSCEGYPVTLGCMINAFGSSAEWKRGNGSVLAVTCSSGNLCTLTSLPIDGVTYSFFGNTSGIYMSTTLPVSEHGINWTCTFSGTPYIYQFELGCSEVTTEGSSEGTTTTPPTTTTTPTTATAPSTSSNTCFFFKEKSCALNYCILAFIVLFIVALLFMIGFFIKRKRNRRHRENSSASGKETKGNKTNAQELQKK